MADGQPQKPRDPAKVGLPIRPFLYTLDQISMLLDVSISTLLSSYIHAEGRTIGVPKKHTMIARNIAPPAANPEWRVAEQELVRWFKVKGFRYYDRSFMAN